jgi:hypothetical protein
MGRKGTYGPISLQHPVSLHPLVGNATAAVEKARQLIKLQPWLDNPEWRARRVVHDPGGLANHLRTGLCLFLAIPPTVLAYDQDIWHPLLFTAFFVMLAGGSLYFGLKGRHGKSVCHLRTVPARIGGAFEAEVAARFRANPGAGARASLAALSTLGRAPAEVWSTEQRIGGEEIRIAADGTWTIPLRIPVPVELRAVRGLDPLYPLWRLEVRVATVGPDFSAQFAVPVYDLADLPYDERKERREDRPPVVHAGLILGPEMGVGVLVGTILGFAIGFGYSDQLHHTQFGNAFVLPLLGATFTFTAIAVWRTLAAAALYGRDFPDRGREMRQRVRLLTLAPWAVAAVVLWLAWLFLPFGALVWGAGMLLCARSAPFGGFWRDPVFQSGAALIACSRLI